MSAPSLSCVPVSLTATGVHHCFLHSSFDISIVASIFTTSARSSSSTSLLPTFFSYYLFTGWSTCRRRFTGAPSSQAYPWKVKPILSTVPQTHPTLTHLYRGTVVLLSGMTFLHLFSPWMLWSVRICILFFMNLPTLQISNPFSSFSSPASTNKLSLWSNINCKLSFAITYWRFLITLYTCLFIHRRLMHPLFCLPLTSISIYMITSSSFISSSLYSVFFLIFFI